MDKHLIAADGAGPQEFKQQIYTQLKKAGVVSSLKSQLRTQLLDQLRKLADPDAVKAAAAAGDQQARGMWHTAVNSMVTEYLQSCGCHYTLSVFKSEADLTELPAFSVDELCQLMRLDRQPQLLDRVQQLLQTEGCLVLALLQALSTTAGSSATVDSECQTSSTAHMEGLSRRLWQLEDSYMNKASRKQGSASRVILEEQMAAYKQECDALVEVQVAARVARVKEVELTAVRQEAAAKYRQQLELDRTELERIHADRLARLAAREEDVTEKLRRQQRDVESIAYTQRQRILAEEERIRGMKAEVSRQLEVQEQLLKGLEAQLKEREKAVAARELTAECKLAEAAELETKLASAARKQAAAELAEEQAALRGERTALEAERARVTELRQAVNADLAVARAKEDRLHSLESARAEAEARSAAHAAGEEVLRLQLKHLQAEVAALQQELIRAGAAAGAAAAAGQHLYASGEAGAAASAAAAAFGGNLAPVQLPQALRELGQLQRQAHETQLALDEALVERDTAASRAEELTVSLNAARREVTALRSQVARQQQDIIQLKLQLGHANAASMAAAAASGRLTALGVRGSLGSLRGISPSLGRPGSVAMSGGGLELHSSSPPRGLGGLGLAVPGRTAAVATSPVSGLSPRAVTTGGLVGGTWGSGSVGPRGLLGQVVSAAGADEGQAAAARIAQLTAADANLSRRIAELRWRSATQRAAAASQLADLKAVAGSSGGVPAGSAVGRMPAVNAGVGTCQQGQPRLSIPSEYDNSELEADLGIDDLSAQELLQQQERREALESALQPPAATAARLAAMAAAPSWPYSSGSRPGTAGAAGVYRLNDVLRLAGGLQASVDSQQAQQEQQQQLGLLQSGHADHQQHWSPDTPDSDVVMQSSAADSPARPHSTNTELSFVQQLQRQGTAEDLTDLQATASSGLSQQQKQQRVSAAEEHDQVGAAGSQGQQAEDAAAPSPTGHTDVEAVMVITPGSVETAHEQQRQQQHQVQEHEGAGPDSLEPKVPAAFPATDAASSTMEQHDSPAAAAVVPAVDQSAEALAQQSQLQEGEQNPHINEALPTAAIDTAADTAAVEEDPAAAAEADEVDEGMDLADDFVAELSALSSAVALEVAAAVEAAHLSSSSSSAGITGFGGDRYSSNRGGGYESDEEEMQGGSQQQDQDLGCAAELEAPGQQRQSSVMYNRLQESAGSWTYSPMDSPQQQKQGVSPVCEPGQASPGWSEASASVGGVWCNAASRGSSTHDADEDEDEVTGRRLQGAAGTASGSPLGAARHLQSPQSSEGSVF